MGIATKTGDTGETSINGERVKKHHPRIEAVGALDELNAILGIACCHIKKKSIKEILYQIQNDIFTLQAELAKYNKKTTPEMTEFLDKTIEALEPQLPKQTGFILPRGTLATTHLHFARTICRRAERKLSKLADYEEINIEIQKYCNRLSDLLHLFARAESDKEHNIEYRA